jgi:hypothetical protein
MRITFYGKDILNDISVSIEASSENDAYDRLNDLLKSGNTNAISNRYSVEYESDMADMQRVSNADVAQEQNTGAAKDQKSKRWISEKLDLIKHKDRYSYGAGWYVVDYNPKDSIVDCCMHCGDSILDSEYAYWDCIDALYCIYCAVDNGAPPLYKTTGWRVYSADRRAQYGSYTSDSEWSARQTAKKTGGRLVRAVRKVSVQ